jgi:hypothetical protein
MDVIMRVGIRDEIQVLGTVGRETRLPQDIYLSILCLIPIWLVHEVTA